MIIDCHGHYTTAPPQLQEYRDAQVAHCEDSARPAPKLAAISDDEIRESVETNQLQALKERGADMTIFSPKASAMAHHIGDEAVSKTWTRINNDMIHRVTQLFPDNFIGVCQLPQSVGVPVENCIEELRRCVLELDFVGCNLNPDPTGGYWTGPPLDDEYWYPLYEAMCELDVPAMIHVSASCNENFYTTGSHYLGADTTAFMQALSSGFMADFDGLRWVIPHGGGAVPYHWGRFRGMALDQGWDFDGLADHIFYDTCVYHQRGIDLLLDVVGGDNVLFASEMVGAVRGVDPETGHHFDDTKRYIDGAALTDEDRAKIFEHNIRRVYPRLDIEPEGKL